MHTAKHGSLEFINTILIILAMSFVENTCSQIFKCSSILSYFHWNKLWAVAIGLVAKINKCGAF